MFLKQFRLCYRLDKEEENSKMLEIHQSALKIKGEKLFANLNLLREEKKRQLLKEENTKNCSLLEK